MLYLANGSSALVRAAMADGELGQLCSPRERRAPLPGVVWAADNSCFGKGYPGDDRYWSWLDRHKPHASRCLFATAPDVIGDAVATWERSRPWLKVIRGLGYWSALVAQDGAEDLALDWDAFDVLFIGGTSDWKLSRAARELVRDAVRRQVPVHFGRVNSAKRLRYATDLGCRSCDGTFLAFGPDTNLPRFRAWTNDDQPALVTSDLLVGS